jgi:hypothetical protein
MTPVLLQNPESSRALDWTEANQKRLVAEFTALRRRLGIEERDAAEEMREPVEPPAAIDVLTQTFGLSGFERDLLLLSAGVEMDSALSARCAEMTGRTHGPCITFALALAVLAEPHWSALAPSAPLRRYRLIDIEAGLGLTAAPLRIEERILHFLAGVNELDARLAMLLELRPQPLWAADEHRAIAKRAGNCSDAAVIHLHGDDARGQEDVAALLADAMGRRLFILRAEDLPTAGPDAEQFVQLWTREALLLPAALLVQMESEAVTNAAQHLLERLSSPLIVASREPMRLHRAMESWEVNKPLPAEQIELWKRALGPASAGLDGMLDNVAGQFRMSAETIFQTAQSIAEPGRRANDEVWWSVCRSATRPRLDSLAERIAQDAAAAGWDDLVLPEAQKQMLRLMALESRYRMTVHETWGFAARGRRGLGLSALFAGPSGTGKTLAAEVLAGELKLDLYRIDLSAVVSKYIGETEKNLKRVFDAAEGGGVVLLFDEADALFGKRAEVKDSHDRYANIEVGYLLQRMESFQGMAILTTNFKSSLDKAFQRRLRFTVDFPFPGAAEREAIWSRIFPTATPTAGLDFGLLAQLNMTGGNIRNIALNAAFLAAADRRPVGMEHLLDATRQEAIKMERPLADVEVRGWI